MNQISQSRSRSADDASLKICIVIESNLNHRYEVFLVDFDETPKSLGSPLFRVPLSFPSFASFFAFGSRIYFVGGSKSTRFSKEVYVWDTSSHNPTLDLVCSMSIGAFCPLVIGPLNEKFYILDHNFSDLDFQEFDPKSNSCKCLPDPPVYVHDQLFVKRYAVVNKDSKILISTEYHEHQLGVYSYDIPKKEWDFHADECLPFEHAISIDKDNDIYLAYTGFRGGFCTCRYNADGNWVDFQELQDDSPLCAPYFCVSLGDGRAWAINSEYDRDIDDYDSYGPEPVTHCVEVARFQAKDGPADLHSVGDLSYQEEPYNGTYFRSVRYSFPLLCNTADAVDPLTTRNKKKSKKKKKKKKNRNRN